MTDRRFEPVDIQQMRLLAQLPPGRRVRVMLDAQALARRLIMGRLRHQYPNASERELGLKLLEELAGADRGFWAAVKEAARQTARRLGDES